MQGAEGSAATNGAERFQPTAPDGQPPQGGKMTLHDIEQKLRIKKQLVKDLEEAGAEKDSPQFFKEAKELVDTLEEQRRNM